MNDSLSSDSFTRIVSWDNLLLAYRKAAKGKRGRESTALFEYRLADNLTELQAELQQRNYQPGAYTNFPDYLEHSAYLIWLRVPA